MSEEEIEDGKKFKKPAFGNQELHVTVDSEQMRSLIKENEQLREENEGTQEAKELLDALKEKASVELTNLGIETNPEDIHTKADLDRAVETIQKLRAKKEFNPAQGGTAPLNQPQITGVSQKEGYSTVKELVDNINQPENKDVRNRVLHKVLKGVIEGKLSLPSYQEPEQKETTTSDLSPDLRLVVKPDPLGIQHAYRKKKLMERAQKGDSQALEILNSGNY